MPSLNYKIYAIDFDDTLCYSDYPALGKPNLALIKKLITLQIAGHKLILWTCRNGKPLQDAIAFCKGYGLSFDAINANLPEILELYGNIDSRKITADYYIDDKGFNPDVLTQ